MILISKEFPQHQFAWKVLGAVLGQTGRKPEAVDANQTAVALSPQDAEAHSNLGVTLKELGRLDEAIDSFKTAYQINPNLDIETAFVEAYLRNEDPDNALPLLEKFLKKYPQDARANAYKTIALQIGRAHV